MYDVCGVWCVVCVLCGVCMMCGVCDDNAGALSLLSSLFVYVICSGPRLPFIFVTLSDVSGESLLQEPCFSILVSTCVSPL